MRIERQQSAGLVIDIQERLFPHMDQQEALLRKTTMLLEGLRLLQIPLVVTEQYPKGLGATLKPISLLLEKEAVLEKISFSCCGDAAVTGKLESLARPSIIICGIEAHVCVLQTAVDLVKLGYRAIVVEDCISSRNPEDKRVAVERMRSEGVVITTCESILFELTEVAAPNPGVRVSQG